MFHIEILQQKLTLSDGENFVFQLPVSKETLKLLKEGCLQSLAPNNIPEVDKTIEESENPYDNGQMWGDSYDVESKN